MKRPPNLVYGVDEKPPLLITLSNGLQHVCGFARNLIFPLVIFKLAGASVATTIELLSVGLVVLGIGTFLQSSRSAVGSGFLCPSNYTATYFSASVLAVKAGGLSLLFGMTLFAGLLEAAISRALPRLRAFLPTELSGVVVFMIGISSGIAGVGMMLGAAAPQAPGEEWLVAGLTLGVMVALDVWGKGAAKMLCPLIGVAVGYAASAAMGLFETGEATEHLVAAPWFALPTLKHAGWSFDITLAATFAIAGIAAAMKTVGAVTLSQRINDADWTRPESRSVARGVLSDGLTTALAGLAGGVGTNAGTASVSVAAATGVTSRHVAYAAGAMFIALGFLPKVAAMFVIMPRAVMAAILLFTACFIIINGLQMIASRLLDVRRTITIGCAIIAGVSVDIFPAIAAGAPGALAPLVASSLAFATVIALGLNLLFRIGVKKTVALKMDRDAVGSTNISDFLQLNGAKWGARPEIISRASFAANQLVEAVAENCWKGGTLTLEASFDEFNLIIHATYLGTPMPFPDKRPTEREIIETDDGMSRLAGFLLRHNADRIRSNSSGAHANIWFHFDH